MSFRLGVYGQASCGCFGKIAVNPWWAFAIDCIAVLALLCCRPTRITAGLKRGIPTIAGAAFILGVVFGASIWWYGSPGSALAHLHGELISVNPEVGDIGASKRGEFADLTLNLTNYSDRPIRIVGGTSNCACVSTDDLPTKINPQQSSAISVRVKFSGSPGQFRRTFVLYTDEEQLKVMPFTATGRVIE
jgi:hypothetical protein